MASRASSAEVSLAWELSLAEQADGPVHTPLWPLSVNHGYYFGCILKVARLHFLKIHIWIFFFFLIWVTLLLMDHLRLFFIFNRTVFEYLVVESGS